jgi:hypothetical protein
MNYDQMKNIFTTVPYLAVCMRFPDSLHDRRHTNSTNPKLLRSLVRMQSLLLTL